MEKTHEGTVTKVNFSSLGSFKQETPERKVKIAFLSGTLLVIQQANYGSTHFLTKSIYLVP